MLRLPCPGQAASSNQTFLDLRTLRESLATIELHIALSLYLEYVSLAKSGQGLQNNLLGQLVWCVIPRSL